MNRKVKVLLIGVGYHAKRIYVPFLKDECRCRLVASLDLLKHRERVENTIRENFGDSASCYFTNEERISDYLTSEEEKQLDEIIIGHSIEAVIISTEPLAHLKYTMWALKRGIHVLLDKPITTEVDVSTNVKAARKLSDDYEKVWTRYNKRCKEKHLVFNLQAQRRYHKAFLKAREKVSEISAMTNCPVTFLQTFHSDGQWTFPNEFVSQSYHPYNQGYGKMSHSGYHSVDIGLWLALSSLEKTKRWDNYRLYSQFIRPLDVIEQFTAEDFRNMFPEMEKEDWDLKTDELRSDMGEVDALTNLSLCRGGNVITSMNFNTLHHSFSRRGWYDSRGRDLYKGNGRVRQESYIIEQGAFQSIVINSFQSEEIQKSNIPEYDVGGEYHFDIHIFRNNNILKDQKAYEKIQLKDLCKIEDKGYSRGHQEDARRMCMVDFFSAILQKTPPVEQNSNLIYHSLSTQILSSVYLSAARAFQNKSPLIKQKIHNQKLIYGK